MKKLLPLLFLPLLFSLQNMVHGKPFLHDEFKVLVFSKTAGFRHGSIPQGIAAIQQLGLTNHFAVVATEDATQFTLANLQQYACVIFLSTTGDVLDATQQTAFENYIRGGGGYVGIHAASDTENSWAWYGQLVGAYFANHPAVQQATVKVSDRVHPSTKSLPTRWIRTDEWYNFNQNPRGTVHVLATLDETSYSGGTHGTDHPIAWCQTFDGGRSWYTGGGHDPSNFSELHFLNHILGGIMYSAGRIPGSFEATDDANYELTVIDNAPANPIELEVMPDGKVIYCERDGRVKLYNPSTSSISVAAQFTVDTQREDGLIGLALPPDFATSQWVYLFYSPVGAGDIQRISRFKFIDNSIDKTTEQIILTIPVQRVACCHSGGYLKFDVQGNLYISVGDNTSPFESEGYAPIDERPGRSTFDAQGTSANTKDLRGKILRIKPSVTVGYTIPAGNLFTDPAVGRPEIYVMGVRNPYRMSIDKKTNYLYWGDVGPDAGAENTNKGFRGHDEWNRTNVAGNFGWPHFIANNKPYKDFDFATGTSSGDFNVNGSTNNSPNNTGATTLPPAKGAWMWYPNNQAPDWPQITPLSGGRTAMAGPVFHYDSANTSAIQMPSYFDKSIFIYEWSNNWFKEVKLDESGNILAINPMFTTFTFSRPIDMTVGPDGAFYIIEWGTGFGGGNPNARIIKIGYKTGARNPVAVISASPQNGPLPLNVNFSAAQSFDPDPGNTLSYFWDFDNNGTDDATGVTASRSYTTRGVYTAKLRVRDNTNRESTSTIQIIAGNNPPVVQIQSPTNGGFFNWGDDLNYNVQVTDVEDGTVSCNAVTIRPAIGHNDHAHDENSLTGCSGAFNTGTGHGGGDSDPDNIFYLLNASYKDKGSNNDPAFSITTTTTHIFNPKRLQAEHFKQNSGVQLESASDVLGGGMNLSFIDNNDYVSYKPANLQNIHNVSFRAASNGPGGFVEIHADSPTGTLLCRRSIPPNGDWQFYNFYSAPITDPGGTKEIFVVFKGGTGALFNLNWIDFYGQGIANSLPSTIQGLKATYYSANNFTGTQVSRNEPVVSFDWESNSPATSIPADNFSADWVGALKPTISANYNLSITGTNGTAEVFIDNSSVARAVNATAESTSISLQAGTTYNIRVAYQHTTGAAGIHLKWRSNGAANATTVPKENLSLIVPPTAPPVITSSGAASGTVGTPFTYTITGTNSPTSYGATGLPPGLNVNTSSGVISGTPTTAGTFNATVTASNTSGTGSKALVITISNQSNQSIPGTIQAESYCAMSGIQLENTSDTGGGQNVGWIDAADWLDFCVTVPTAGTYVVNARVASPNSGGQFQLKIGSTVLTTMNVPNTGGWQTWTTINSSVNLNAGTQTIRLQVITGGFNINWLQFSAPVGAPVISSAGTASGTVGTAFSYTITASNSPTSYGASSLPAGLSVNTSSGVISGTPTTEGTFNSTITATNAGGTGSKALTITINNTSQAAYPNGIPWAIPGTIEAENFDTGGEGIAYHDNDAINSGGQGRLSDGVDTETCSEGGLNIGWTNTGEWYEYTVNIQQTATYNIEVRTASIFSGGSFHIEFNGINKTGTMATTNTGAWQTWTTITKTGVSLEAGVQVMRIYLDNANFNLNKVIITGAIVVDPSITVSPTNASVPVGSTQQLTATTTPPTTVDWMSNNTSIATVSTNGLVTAIAVGTATITASRQDNGMAATSSITVPSSTDPAGVITCYKAPGTITVNGSLTETGWNVTRSFSKVTVGSPNNTATFGVLWDNTNLYIGAKVLDANLFSDSPNPWEDDAVEIYIDANNNKLTSYDGLDNQIIKNYNKSTVFTKLAISGLQHAWAAISGGYSIEIAIPWSQLGISAPAQNTTIGFDIGYDDDDNGGAREHQAVWNGTVNNWQNTSAFGSLVLNAGTSGAGERQSTNSSAVADPEEAMEQSTVSVSVTPNPVKNGKVRISLPAHDRPVPLQIINITGRVIHESIIEGNEKIADLSGESKGLYLIKVIVDDKLIIRKVVVE